VESVMALENVSDTIIFDTGAGINDNTLRLIHASDDTILVTTPEPTSVVDAYALLKIVNEQGIRPDVSLVLNRVENVREAASVMDGLIRIVEKNTEIQIKKLGVITQDANMLSAVKEQVPILISHPYCAASADINQLVNSFLNIPVPQRKKTGLAGFFDRFIMKSGMAKG
jgi:flagellar biosynthesis protein FlhG